MNVRRGSIQVDADSTVFVTVFGEGDDLHVRVDSHEDLGILENRLKAAGCPLAKEELDEFVSYNN